MEKKEHFGRCVCCGSITPYTYITICSSCDSDMCNGIGMNEPQPQPDKNAAGKQIWDLVMLDMKSRNVLGAKKYGTTLRSFNGRRPLVDAYQECLDLCVYLRQAIEEDR